MTSGSRLCRAWYLARCVGSIDQRVIKVCKHGRVVCAVSRHSAVLDQPPRERSFVGDHPEVVFEVPGTDHSDHREGAQANGSVSRTAGSAVPHRHVRFRRRQVRRNRPEVAFEMPGMSRFSEDTRDPASVCDAPPGAARASKHRFGVVRQRVIVAMPQRNRKREPWRRDAVGAPVAAMVQGRRRQGLARERVRSPCRCRVGELYPSTLERVQLLRPGWGCFWCGIKP